MVVIDVEFPGRPLLQVTGQVVPDNVAVIGTVKVAVAVQIGPDHLPGPQLLHPLVGQQELFRVRAVDDPVAGLYGLAGELAAPYNLQSAIAGVMSCLGLVICDAALSKWR